MNVCPCCRQALADEQPLVDLQTNRLAYVGKLVLLERQEADLAFVLARAMPITVGYDDMLAAIYGRRAPPKCGHNVLSQRAATLRRKLSAVGLAVRNSPSLGYRLEAVAPVSKTPSGVALQTEENA